MKININHKVQYTTLFISSFVWFFISCGSNKNIEPSQSSIESEPKIIFLNYSIKKTGDGQRSIKFIDKIVKDGKLKNTPSDETGISGDLICVQLDKKSKVLQRVIIKNPLAKNIEYLDESKSFQRKQIDLDSTRFSIRLQLKPNAKHISISEFTTFENQEKPLIKTQIY